MNKITSVKEFEKELININNGEAIFINLDENVSNRLLLMVLQLDSYDKLFMSYINSTIEEANKFNLNNFLSKYSELYIKKYDAIKETLINIVGVEIYKIIIDNNIDYSINYDLNYIKLYK